MKLFHRDDVNTFHRWGWLKSAMLTLLFVLLVSIPNISRADITWTSVGEVGSDLGVTFNDVAHADFNEEEFRADLDAALEEASRAADIKFASQIERFKADMEAVKAIYQPLQAVNP